MLTHLRIRNFKSWEDTGRIRLAPITVFFGTNSSGKSSLGQFLLVLKQTAESTDRTQVLRTSDEKNVPVDVGDFADLIHRHDVSRELAFELGWRQERPLEIEDAKDPETHYSSSTITFDGEIYQPQSARERMRVRRFAYSFGTDQISAPFSAGMEPDPKRSSRYRLDFRGFTPVHNRGRAWELPSPSRFYGFPDEAVAYYQNTEFLPDLSLAFERILSTLSYLGPLRVDPERTYNWLGGAPPDVGWAGEQTIQAILAGGDRRLNLRHRERLRSLTAMIAYQLQELGLIESFRVVAIAEGRPEHEVRVKVSGGTDEVLLTDVGFGISQVLPVLVQSFYVAPNSTILMEQPELHLHPRVQMQLADFFINAAGARQQTTPGKSIERRTQFLIESHSEHFLRRLQRRIAENRIGPDQIALYFCEMKAGRSTLRELDVDLFGNILKLAEGLLRRPDGRHRGAGGGPTEAPAQGRSLTPSSDLNRCLMSRPRSVVDTNVGIAANLKAEVSPECALACVQTIRSITDDGHLVLDDGDHIFSEYRRHLSLAGQPGVGDAFIRWIHDNRFNTEQCTLVTITPTDDGSFVEFPSHEGLATFDRSDRKFVTVAAVDSGSTTIRVALDRGWSRHAAALQEAGVLIDFVCPGELRPAA